MRKRIAVFGGTFDPPQVGHVLAAHYVLLTEDVDRILVVPCARHPFGKEHAPLPLRLAMCRLAFEPLGEKVEVLDLEGRREGPSYTVDTLRDLRKAFPDADFELVVGSDLLGEIEEWKEAEEVKRLAALRVLPRLTENVAKSEEDQETPFYLPRVSSTAVRSMLAQGKDVSRRVPREVLAYIRRHGLYEKPAPSPKTPID